MTVNHTPFRSDLFTSGGAVCSTQCRLADLLTVRACAAGSGGGAGGGGAGAIVSQTPAAAGWFMGYAVFS